ncbi:penicillin-binding protein 1C [Sphingobacteriaceae bacterium]|nr:penicillin-binding protein 1C [Sphingobacteriaceae bacterium]
MALKQKIISFLGRHKIKLSVLFLGVLLFWLWLPSKLFDKPCSSVLLDKNDELLAAQIASDGQWRFPQSDSIPYKFKTCIVTFEDEYFSYHPGFNPVSIYNSLKRNLHSSKIKSGGSTITMQVARMMRNNQNRNYYQKIVEILLAVRIEASYKKTSILNLYCSNAPFGSNVVGLAAASWRYFGRSPEKLSWAESAVLAVLPNAPSLIYPGKNQKRLLKKRNRLLEKLFKKNTIDSATYQLAILEPLPHKPFPIPQLAPHLLATCAAKNGSSKIYHSTLLKDLQLHVTELLNRHSQNLSANQIHNACALVVETESGKVLAYVGNSFSSTNEHQNYVDVIQAPRSTGSILKPFLYAFMLNENKLLPASLLEDIPTRIGSYGPKNFSLSYDGLVPANQAIARSLNIPAVKMLQDYGAQKFHQRLKQLGFTTFKRSTDRYGLSLILGGGEAKLFEITAAYCSMARALLHYSNKRNLYADKSYHALNYLRNQQREKVSVKLKSDILNASAIYYTFLAMTELLRPQDYTGWAQFLSKSKIAWKTGTSFGFRDAWAVGVNPKYTVAIWVGNADGEGRPELTGTSAAAPLMFSIFNVLENQKWFQKPTSDLEKIKICKQSGYKASQICDQTEVRDYPKGAQKTRPCPFHKLIHLDETGMYRVSSSCYPVSKMLHQAWFIASPAEEYFYKQHNMQYKSLPPYLSGCENETTHKELDIIYPKEGFQIYVPVDQSGEQSRCIFKATHKNPNATLFWHLDGQYIGETRKFHQVSVIPKSGPHFCEITDDLGESVSCSFSVLAK